MADPLLPATADYTDKDFDSVRKRLFGLIRTVFPIWTDTAVANFGNILVELFSWTQDVLAFYMDNQAAESRITTAVQRRNLLALVKLLNYEPATARAAQVLERFTAANLEAGDSIILGGTGVGARNPLPIVVKTPDGTKYELQQTVTLTSGAPTRWGLVEHSELHSEVFDADTLVGSELRLSRPGYLDGSAAITAGNGDYIEVPNFLGSSATDLHFTVHTDNLDAATIRFGNGVSGAAPVGSILVSYKTGGGTRGNVLENSITLIDGTFQSEAGRSVTIEVTNETERAVGGLDRESEAQIKEKAPLSLRVLTRAIAREDFEILAKTRYGMARALMLTDSEDAALPENTGFLYVIPPVGRGQALGFPTVAKQEEILRRMRTEFPWPTTFMVQSRMPAFLKISLTARIHLRKGYSITQAQSQVRAALLDYFALYNADGSTNTRIDFGYYYESGAADSAKVLPLSDLQNSVRDAVAVHRLSPNPAHFTISAESDDNTSVTTILTPGSHVDIPIKRHEFPMLSGLTLVDAATGTSHVVTLYEA